MVRRRDPVDRRVHRQFPFADGGAAHRRKAAAVAIAFEHRQHRRRQRRHGLAVDDGAGRAAEEADVDAIVAARVVQQPDQLGHRLRFERAARVALLDDVQLTAVADENREPAGRVRWNLNRHGRDLFLAAIAAREDLERRRAACARPDVVEPDALDGDAARRFGGGDRDVESLERDRLDVVREQHRHRPGDGGRGAENRRVAGEHVFDVQVRVALDARAALDADGRRAELPLVRRQRVEHRHVGDERREHLIVDDRVLERALRARQRRRRRCHPTDRSSVTVIGTSAGPLPSVPAIAVGRSCVMVPIVSPIDEILNDVSRLGRIV